MKSAWLKYDEENIHQVMDFSEKYKSFLDNAKTEREFVEQAIKLIREHGYKDFNEITKVNYGDKIYFNNHGKSLIIFKVGKQDFECGMNILGAHIDSPRIDIKQNPLYEDNNLVLLDTHYYGGIKKYQWTARALAIHGVICKKDGTTVTVKIGEDENDPVFEISDLLVHLSRNQMEKPAANVIEGEDLNALVGSIPTDEEKDSTKKRILDILKEKYDIEEQDFLSAELELVPSGKARDLGFDRSMIFAYGQDDRVCAYASLMAILESEDNERTACCVLVDKEEIGSVGISGAQSAYFEYAVSELISKTCDYNELKLRKTFKNSYMLSSDVSIAYDPNYPSVNELKNTAFLGNGLGINKFTGSRGKGGASDANAEYVAKIRKLFDDNNVSYQFNELGKVDVGGGGTIAFTFANRNIEVIDSGIPVQNMHAPYEVSSKADIYEGYLGYKAFLKEMK